jgi:hypothetical protein
MKLRRNMWGPVLSFGIAFSSLLIAEPHFPIGPIPGIQGIAYAAPVPIIYIDARERSGTEIGAAVGNSIKTTFPGITLKMDAYLADFIGYIAYQTGDSAQDLFDYYAVPRINAIKTNIEERYKAEVNAIGSSLGLSGTDLLGDGALSSNELWAIQLLPDIARETNCSGFGVFGDYSISGSSIVGRNLDWHTTLDLQSIQAVTVYVYEDRALVNIGFAGFAGVLTGYNSNGLFGAILDSPLGGEYPDWPYDKRSYVFDLRNALEVCTSISQASSFLYDKPYAYSHNMLFADPTDVQVLEHPQGMNGQVRTDQSPLQSDLSWGRSNQIAVVNFFALASLPANERYFHNYDRWDRFRALAGFNAGSKASEEGIESIMLDTVGGIFNNDTVQSLVFNTAEKKLYLYARGITSSTTMELVLVSDDVDGDGLPDNWETDYFGHLSYEDTEDPDGDGVTNLQEYRHGTDPTDPNDFAENKAMPWIPLLLLDD